MLRPLCRRLEHLGASWDQALEHLLASSGLRLKEGIMRLSNMQV
jgi:hypothetical protein